MKCTIENCSEQAVGLFTWGNYPNGDHNREVALCISHADDLWQRIKPGTAAGITHFAVATIPAAREAEKATVS